MLIDKDGDNRVSVQEVLLELRKYRMGLIQTHDQLTFSYEAIIEGMKRMNNDVSFLSRDFPGITFDDSNFFSRVQTFNELDNLEIATGSDHEEENAPPPLPPRTTSCPLVERPLPTSPSDSSRKIDISEPSDPTSSDVSDILDDSSSSSDSESDDDDEDVKTLQNGQREFDANSSLPPVPNGTLDLTIPSDKQRFSSDDER